jgi:toxin YoeB
MLKAFDDPAWEDYLFWQEQDKKTWRKINDLIKDIARNGNSGIGHPEPLKNMPGYWSREINKKNRLVYTIKEQLIIIAQCRNHYGDH